MQQQASTTSSERNRQKAAQMSVVKPIIHTRSSYYRRLLCERNGEAKRIQQIIEKLHTAISNILAIRNYT